MSASVAAPVIARRLPSGMVSIGRSLAINLLGPWLLYRAVAPHCPPGSILPLLVVTLIPLGDLAYGLARRRVLDVIALITLVQMVLGLGITLFSGNAHAALMAHALQNGAMGLVFAGSALIGRPLIQPLARQSMAGDDPVRQARFDAHAGLPTVRRAFMVMTWIWAVSLCAEAAVRVVALHHLAPANYLLLSTVLGYGLNGALIWGCVRYGRGRATARAKAEAS